MHKLARFYGPPCIVMRVPDDWPRIMWVGEVKSSQVILLVNYAKYKYKLKNNATIWSTVTGYHTDLYKYSPDAVRPIHAVSYHVATDNSPPPAQDGDKFRSIFSDNLQPITTRGKEVRGTLLVDQHCGNGCSIKRASLSHWGGSHHSQAISGGHIWRGGLYGGGVLPAQYCPCGLSEKKQITVTDLLTTGLIPRTLGPSNDFTLLNGWICLHGVLD